MKVCLLMIFSLFLAFPLYAMETKPETLVCISKKKLATYEKREKQKETDFLKKMQQKAECVVMQKPLKVVIDAEVGSYARVETLEGMKLWLRKESLR